MTGALHLVTEGPAETQAVAGALAGLAMPGDILLLVGDLGAGKTTFAQGFGAALGIEEPMTSPTFTLVRQYPLGDSRPAGPASDPDPPPGSASGPAPGSASGRPPGDVRTLFHADLYRLDRLGEIVDLGLGELVEDGGVALVEWGDAAEPLLGRGSLHVALVVPESAVERRLITLEPSDDGWFSRWVSVREALAAWSVVP